MYKIFSTFILTALIFITSHAQQPEYIKLETGNTPVGSIRSCSDQFAGTWSRGTFTGNSNDVANTVMFLCGGDQLQIIGGRDANLDADPIPATLPGIAYAFYTCPPTVSGPSRDDVLTDPCLATIEPPAAEGIIAARGNPQGDISILNNGNIQSLFGSGSPVQMWFAPITVDNFSNLSWEGNPAGQCIHVNTAAAFSFVYLNPISIDNISTPSGTALNGTFRIRGGLPEFDGSNYTTLRIELVSDPSIQGTITNAANQGHDAIVNFSVPEEGQYRIVARDGKSCPADITLNMPRNAVNLIISPHQDVPLGADVCYEVSLSNAIDIVSFQFTIDWDPNVLRFTGIGLPDPHPISDYAVNTTEFDEGNFGLTGQADPASQGRLTVSWFDLGLNGFTITDEAVIFTICFVAIGQPGTTTPIDFVSTGTSPIEFADSTNLVNVTTNESSATIIDPTNISIITRVCSSSNNMGTLAFEPYGATPPYQFLLEGPGGFEETGNVPSAGTPVSFDNLVPGDYILTLTPASGGGGIFTIVVANSNRLAVDVTDVRNPRCFGNTNGFIQTLASGGTEPYRYNWSNGQTGTNRASQLGSGTYQLTVTDARGCTAVTSATLDVAPILLDFEVVNPSCNGTSNGSARVIASGGAGNYTYSWNNQVFSDTRTNLAAGCYDVTVDDANNCVVSGTICLENEKIVNMEVTSESPFCAGDNSGSITVNIIEVGGSPSNYNFAWNPGIGVITSAARTSTQSNLPAGVYTISASNADGCQIQETIELNNPPGMRITRVTGVAADCTEGATNGSITLTTSGGSGTKTYSWNDGAFTGNSLTGVPPGAYTVTVTDENGCTADSTFFVGPFAGFNVTPESCAGNGDGAIVSIIEFDDDFSISLVWSNGANTSNLSGLTAGTYTVTITGSSPNVPEDCVLVFEVEVPVAERFTIQDNSIRPSCPGSSDGVINITVIGGQGPFTYNWAHSIQDEPLLTMQRAGDYTVSISDQSGCPPLEFTITLEQPPFIMFSFAEITGASCAGADCDGSAVLTLSNGSVPGGNFDVSWNDQTVEGVRTVLLTNLCPGENVITAVDENGCVRTNTVPIPGPEPIAIDMDNSLIENVSCNGAADGSIQLQAMGGTGPYTYFWPQQGVNGPNLSALSPGDYIIQITDNRDCSFEGLLSITEPDPLILVIDTDNTQSVGCSGAADGRITVIPVGGNDGDRIFTWDPNVSQTEIAENLDAGFYTVTVTDRRGCTDEISYEILEPQPIVATIPTPQEPLCNGEPTIIEVTEASGGSGGPFRYRVNGGPLIPVGTPFPNIAGTILIEIFDARNCSWDTTLVVNQPPAILVDLGDGIEMDLGDTIRLNPIVTPLGVEYNYNWSPAALLSCADCSNPDAFPINTTDFMVTVTDANGCTGTGQVNIRVLKRRLVYIPTGFTPNNDGINDRFEVYTGRGIRAINHMRVYDRWGNMMYELQDLNFNDAGSDGWNGEFRGRMADPGVYVYTVEVEFVDNTVLLYRGEVTLHR